MWRHPKYYAELRKQARQQARKLTSSQANEPRVRARKPKAQAASQSPQAPGSESRGTSEPSPCPGNKQQE
jgi:hypothetical protein